MNPGTTIAPPTSMMRSWRQAGSTAPTAAIRPSRIDKSPSITSRASFMVSSVALVSFSDAMAARRGDRASAAGRRALELGHPLERRRGDGRIGAAPAPDGDELGEDAHGDLLRRDR